MQRYTDPRLDVQGAVPRMLSDIVGGTVEGLAGYRAARESRKERGRGREVEPERERLYQILRFGDPDSEEYQQAVLDMEKLGGAEYVHQFKVGDKRAKRRVIRGKSEFPEAKPQPLASGEDMSRLHGAVGARRGDVYEADEAVIRARREAGIPMEVTAEELERQGKEPTTITGKGSEWDVKDEAWAGIEAAKIRARGAGGSGAGGARVKDLTSGKKRIVDLYLYEYGQDGQPVYKQVLGPTGQPVSEGAQNVYNQVAEQMIAASSPDEIDAILTQAEAALASSSPIARGAGIGDTQENQTITGRLRGLRADLYNIHGQRQGEAEPEKKKEDDQTAIQKQYGGKGLPD